MSLLPVIFVCCFAPAPFPRPSGAYLGADFLPSANEPVINGVFVSSPAMTAGLGTGDKLIAIDGTKLNTLADLAAFLRRKKPGDVVRMTVGRGNEVSLVKVTLATPFRAHLGIWFAGDTLHVSEVVADSPAKRAGLRVDDLIVAMNGKKVQTQAAVIEFLKTKRPGNTVTITIQRGKEEVKVTVRLGRRPGY
jgi:S1-C subfamily serine protease